MSSRDVRIVCPRPNLDTGWSELSTSSPGRFSPRRKEVHYPWNRRLGGPQSRSGRFGEAKNLLPLSGIEPATAPAVPQWLPTDFHWRYIYKSTDIINVYLPCDVLCWTCAKDLPAVYGSISHTSTAVCFGHLCVCRPAFVTAFLSRVETQWHDLSREVLAKI